LNSPFRTSPSFLLLTIATILFFSVLPGCDSQTRLPEPEEGSNLPTQPPSSEDALTKGKGLWKSAHNFHPDDPRRADLTRQALDVYIAALKLGDARPEIVLAVTETINALDPPPYDEAIDILREVVGSDPGNLHARVELGTALFRSGKNDPAATVLAEAIDSPGKSPDDKELIKAHEFLGRAHLAAGRSDAARKHLDESVRRLDRYRKKHGEGDFYYGCPYQAMGELYFSASDLDKTAEWFRRAADAEPNTADSQIAAANALFENGDVDAALTYVSRALKLDGSLRAKSLKARIEQAAKIDRSAPDPATSFATGLLHFQAGDIGSAVRTVERISDEQATPKLSVLKGILLLFQQKYDPAQQLFDRAQQGEKTHLASDAGKGHLAIVRKDFESAHKLLLPAAELPLLDETDERRFAQEMACLGMGWLLSNQNKHAEALAYYDKLLALVPNHFLAVLGKGNALSGLGRFDEAERFFRKALHLQPSDPYATAEMALIHYNRGQFDLAESEFQKAANLGEGRYTCPYEGLGLVYMKQGRLDQARENFERAIKINPDIEYKKFNGLAKIMLEKGENERAEKLLRKSIENYPFDSEARLLLDKIEQRSVEENHGD
jgi:tetratricopeptide (TPR) repeat protein